MIPVYVSKLSGDERVINVPDDVTVKLLKIESSAAFGLDASEITLVAGIVPLSDRDTLREHIQSVGDPPTLGLKLQLIVTPKPPDPYEELVAAKAVHKKEERVSKHASRKGEWVIIREKHHHKEDEENEYSDLYYLPTWKRGCVKWTRANVPDTMMPSGEYMSFSSDESLKITDVRTDRVEYVALSTLTPQ